MRELVLNRGREGRGKEKCQYTLHGCNRYRETDSGEENGLLIFIGQIKGIREI